MQSHMIIWQSLWLAAPRRAPREGSCIPSRRWQALHPERAAAEELSRVRRILSFKANRKGSDT
jgi:hypothetical protein